MVDADVFKGKWHQMKGGLRERWGELTDDDVDRIAGRSEVLAGILQERYGYAKDRAETEIDQWNDDYKPGK